MRALKLIIALCLVAAVLTGCISQPIAPTEDTQFTGNADPDATSGSGETTVPETGPVTTLPDETRPTATEPDPTEPPATDATEPTDAVPDVTDPTDAVPDTDGCTHAYQIQNMTATCWEGGYTDYTCTLCGHSYRENSYALGHSYGAWDTTAATCTQNGSRSRTCSRCSHKQTEQLFASGHAYGTGTVLKEAASCSELGTIRYTCSRCGDDHQTSYQGNHRFGEPYATMVHGIRIQCEDCGYEITDYYTWWESSFSDQDKTKALYLDTIKLKESIYTGPLSTWSEDWMEWHAHIRAVLQAKARGGVELSISEKLSDHGGTVESFLQEFNRFLDAFAAYYGWRPIWVGDPYVEDGNIDLLFETDRLFTLYEAGTNAMSSSQREALMKDLLAFYVHDLGLRDGMQVYNSIGAICDLLYYDLLGYDQNYRYNSAFRGLTCGITMCQGYSEVFQLFAEYCGIKCEIVEGTMMGEAHAWNRVTFSDGTQRYVDVTNLGYDYYILVPWDAMSHTHKLKG